MPEEIEITEAVETRVSLTDSQVTAINEHSRFLASSRSWWGAIGEEELERHVISVTPRGGGSYSLTVRNAVGVLAVDGLSIFVKPKIPLDHFVYIASHALFSDERSGSGDVDLMEGTSFQELVAGWVVQGVRQIVRGGLSSDYELIRDSLPYVRGRIAMTKTALNFHKGTVAIESEFEDRTNNSPENRILRSALDLLNPRLLGSEKHRQEVQLLRTVFWGVERASEADLKLPSRSFPPRYRRTVDMAISLLRNSGRSLTSGPSASKSFLVRTPGIMEDGLREIIRRGLQPVRVAKGGKVLSPTTLRVNPDLLVTNVPFTADVKYKKFGPMWNRNDLFCGEL
jgi:hypothetical protein